MSEMKCLRVLYIEDDDSAREALCRYLKPRVGKVLTAASGEEGLKKYEEYKPNLLIVDLILPGMSGLELITAIREADKKIKVLVASSVSEIQTVLDAVDQRIEHYILKPIDTEDLEQKMLTIAEELKENRLEDQGILTINQSMVEDSVRRFVVSMLKTHTGKGPGDLKILMTSHTMEIHVVDAYTVMEKTLLSNKLHVSLTEQYRKQLYEELTPMLEDFISNTACVKAHMVSVKVDGIKKNDKLVLTWGPNL